MDIGSSYKNHIGCYSSSFEYKGIGGSSKTTATLLPPALCNNRKGIRGSYKNTFHICHYLSSCMIIKRHREFLLNSPKGELRDTPRLIFFIKEKKYEISNNKVVQSS